MSEQPKKKSKKDKQKQQAAQSCDKQARKQQKRRKKQLKQKQQKQRMQRQMQAQVDSMVSPIYTSGLADAYKYFLQELYKEGVRFNIYEYAAQKILKFQKNRKDRAKRIEELGIQ